MADEWIELNSGSGGSVLDTEAVTYGTPPLIRERERIEVTGEGIDEIARVISATPTEDLHGLVTRAVNAKISPTGDGVGGGGNSTTTPLAAAGSFVGAWEDVGQYASVGIILVTDQTSAVNGGTVQWSNDGITALRTIANTIVGTAQGGGPLYFSFPVEAKFFRLVYTNGATPQTNFRVQTVFHVEPLSIAQAPLAATLNDLNIAGLVKGIQAGRQPSGAYLNIPASGVDSGNSTTTPLGAAGTFTGTAREIIGFHSISVHAFSDVAGTVQAQFSNDAANWDTTVSRPYPGGSGQGYVFVPIARYMRVVFVNGASPQTVFRLQTNLYSQPLGSVFSRLDTTLSDATLSQQTRAVLTGKIEDPSTAYTNIRASNEGDLLVAVGNRPSEVHQRTHVTAATAGATADTTIFTVTVGKVFYLTSIIWSMFNSSTTVAGDVRIKNGGAGGALKIPISVPEAASVGADGFAQGAISFPEPVPFTTDVFADIVAGTITMSITVIGYEEQ